MSSTPSDRSNPCFRFLRRLQAGGRSNMYGAIPYLMAEFGCNRDEGFRIVCDWLDQQATTMQSERAEVIESKPAAARSHAARKASRGRAA